MMNHKIIYKLYPQVTEIRGDLAYDSIGNIVEYDRDAVQAEMDAIAYKEQRAKNYPSIADQLDMLWHAIDTNSLNKTSDFYTAIKAVKDAHPKE
jgi:hypothetical protein